MSRSLHLAIEVMSHAQATSACKFQNCFFCNAKKEAPNFGHVTTSLDVASLALKRRTAPLQQDVCKK